MAWFELFNIMYTLVATKRDIIEFRRYIGVQLGKSIIYLMALAYGNRT